MRYILSLFLGMIILIIMMVGMITIYEFQQRKLLDLAEQAINYASEAQKMTEKVVTSALWTLDGQKTCTSTQELTE